MKCRAPCEDIETYRPRGKMPHEDGDRLELCCHKPRNLWDYPKPRDKEGSAPGGCRASVVLPALILDVCYSSLRKFTHGFCRV